MKFIHLLILILFVITPLYLNKYLVPPSLSFPKFKTEDLEKKSCDIFKGKWVPTNSHEPYYTNETCNWIINQQNCIKFGRPDREYLKWRWSPDECELPLFDAVQFLELMRDKSLAFISDSVGRNQLQSLFCLLAKVGYPEDISKDRTSYDESKRWFYPKYNFTLAAFWSPYLVKNKNPDPNNYSYSSILNLYLDEADQTWASEIESFHYVIISAGQWFFRPLMLHQNGQVIGCSGCLQSNIKQYTNYYAYRMAFRTAFRALERLENYKGVTFLRTFSPAHFENGEWNKGGNCERKSPFEKEEVKFDGFVLEMYLNQVEEYRVAEKKGVKNGMKLKLLDTTEAMLMRPDGHPNHYAPLKNSSIADCVHWCSPGPIDTWNEFLLYMLKDNS